MSVDIQVARMSPEESGKDVDVWSSLSCLGYLSSLNLLVAVCLGMYVQWEHTSEPTILVIFILGLLVLGISSILYYYFSMEWASLSLFHLWFGFLQGLLCFLNSSSLDTDVKEHVTNYLLLASVGVRALWALTERMCGSASYERAVLTSVELLELLGFAIASTIMELHKSSAVIALLAALAAIIVDLRMKSLLALPNLVFFSVVVSVTFFQALEVHANPYALGCYLGRLVCEPLLDVYFSGLSVTERWIPFLLIGRLWHRLSLLPLAVAELTFFVLCAIKLGDLKYWYLVIPGFCVFGLFWVLCHVVLLVTVWGFHTKLSECQKVRAAQRVDVCAIDRIMASRGMRHFCLISERLVFFSLVSTGILGAVSWQLSSALFMGLFLLVLPLESLAHGLFHELGSGLGGTCVGYAVIVPTGYCSVDGQPTLLPHEQVLELNAHSTATLSAVQRLFSHHLVQTFGCDYSTGGLGLEALMSKLRSFLDLRTADGPRHDTYLLYYSGHTRPTGDWALTGGDCVRLEQILDLWRERNVGYSSRLILVLDTENAGPWVKAARRVEGLYVAVQGAELSPAGDAESQAGPRLGDFTREWVEYNCDPDSPVQWSERGRRVAASYGVSRCWSDYSLHLPTGCDVAKHWKTYFPRATYPLVTVANWCCGLNLLWLCSACLRCVRRLKLAWFPPTVLDTGHGIKLVRS
ncbi:transmembrane protein 168-A [Brachyhypopomus gauderio]|uniref:transmembrane protein 168-A n=1 Tax=Brachyhypopomus gauderio TaxID=698409 RepID=UPI0040419F66